MIWLDNGVMVAHVPKTGGTTMAEILRKSGFVCLGREHHHGRYPDERAPVVAGVRDPLDWMRSLWAHRKRRDSFAWRLGRRLERICGNVDEVRFLGNIASHPGIVLEYQLGFVGHHLDLWIVRTENMLEDMLRVFGRLLPRLARKLCDNAFLRDVEAGLGQPLGAWNQIAKRKIPGSLEREFRDSQDDFYEWRSRLVFPDEAAAVESLRGIQS